MARCVVWTFVILAGCFGGSSDFSPQGNALPADATAPYRLPWSCGESFTTSQGNDGDLCGFPGATHVGIQEFAFDFALPRGTPVHAARAGTVTLAATAT